jgi:predicted GH43/DUF377 family glycosyl hydrolase
MRTAPLAMLLVAILVLPAGGMLSREARPVQELQPVPPSGAIDPFGITRDIISRIDGGLVVQHIQALQDYGTRYVYSPQGWLCAEYIFGVMERCGLSVAYDEFYVGNNLMRNVIGELPGLDANSTEIYIICGHYDTWSPQKWTAAPGADDDASGVAGVLAAAELLGQYRFNHTIRFCAWGGEELGLYGSWDYANRMYEQGVDIRGVLNLDVIAYHTLVDSAYIWMYTNGPSEPLANLTLNVSAAYGELLLGVEPLKLVQEVSYSDHYPFWLNGYNALLFIEGDDDFTPWIHTPYDSVDTLNLTFCAGTVRLAIATLCGLAELASDDELGPVCRGEAPSPGGYGNETPVISVIVSDSSGVDPGSIRLYVNGYALFHEASPVPLGFRVRSWQDMPMADGAEMRCKLVAEDTRGNQATHYWNFTIDAVPPAPPTGLSASLDFVGSDKYGIVMYPGQTDNDSRHVELPSVLYRNSEYKMWYAGSDLYQMTRILYANSSDGINWTTRRTVIDVGHEFGEPDTAGATDCTVLWDGEYRMWYTGYDDYQLGRIVYANSSDGLHWTKRGVAVDVGAAGDWDEGAAHAPCVLKVGSIYKMWYAGMSHSRDRIMRAESLDGTNWTKLGGALDIGPLGSLDCYSVSDPYVALEGGAYVMWYTGSNGSKSCAMEARSSDGGNWSRLGVRVVVGEVGWPDSRKVFGACGVEGPAGTLIYYTGLSDDSTRRIHLAFANASQKPDVLVSWNASPSADVVSYRVAHSDTWEGLASGLALREDAAGTSTPWSPPWTASATWLPGGRSRRSSVAHSRWSGPSSARRSVRGQWDSSRRWRVCHPGSTRWPTMPPTLGTAGGRTTPRGRTRSTTWMPWRPTRACGSWPTRTRRMSSRA